MSFEFSIPETFEQTMKSIDHLAQIGYLKFNVSFGEAMIFPSTVNVDVKQIKDLFQSLSSMSWGYIYAFSE